MILAAVQFLITPVDLFDLGLGSHGHRLWRHQLILEAGQHPFLNLRPYDGADILAVSAPLSVAAAIAVPEHDTVDATATAAVHQAGQQEFRPPLFGQTIGAGLAQMPGLGGRVAQESDAVIAARGKPPMIVSDNGTEFISRAILAWTEAHKVEGHYIQPGKPTQNAFVESFTGRLRDKCLIKPCSTVCGTPDRC